MTQAEQKEIDDLCKTIQKVEENRLKSDKIHRKIDNEFDEFLNIFTGNKGWYLIQGVICIAVLIFDFWVSAKSLAYLATIIRIRVEFIAILFSILDACIAVLASGGLAGNNLVKAKFQKRLWKPVLVILALVKIILFTFFIIQSYPDMNTLALIQVILPQIFFIVIIYFVFGLAGLGLWFILGRVFFGIKRMLYENPETLQSKINEYCSDLKILANNYNANLSEIIDFHSIGHICKNNKGNQNV